MKKANEYLKPAQKEYNQGKTFTAPETFAALKAIQNAQIDAYNDAVNDAEITNELSNPYDSNSVEYFLDEQSILKLKK